MLRYLNLPWELVVYVSSMTNILVLTTECDKGHDKVKYSTVQSSCFGKKQYRLIHEFHQKLRQQLKEIYPNSIIQDQFKTHAEMAEMFSATRLNVHPCAYDAFGMTIVEAASQVRTF